ncbi:MAG: RidA family protein [Streptosporangiales bacterium]|nr:RidA family protein [Streptosporangiales bacterium]
MVAAPGRIVCLGGQTGSLPDGSIAAATLAEQFDRAAGNVAAALAAAGGRPEHLVQLTVYTTDMRAYRASLRDLGLAYRRHLGRHYPAMALFGVSELFDPKALVELVGVAVIPE